MRDLRIVFSCGAIAVLLLASLAEAQRSETNYDEARVPE